MASLDLNDFITIGFISKEENSVLRVQSVKNKKEYALKKIKRFDLKTHLKDIQGILNIIACDHPNIVKILGFSIIQQKKDCKNEYILCLLMDCYSKNLETDILERSNQKNHYSKDEFLKLIEQIHSILYHMQTNIKMAHRDINPSNILISNTGTLLLTDFTESFLKTDIKERSTSVVGTPYFMAPEIRELYIKADFSEGNNYNPWKSDVFSMGMTFLDCACLTIAEKGNLNEKIIHLEKLYGKEVRDFVEVCVRREEIDRMDFEELSESKEYEKILGKFKRVKV